MRTSDGLERTMHDEVVEPLRADSWEGDGRAVMFPRETERAPVAGGEELRLAVTATTPDGTDRMDHETSRQAEGGSDPDLSRRAADPWPHLRDLQTCHHGAEAARMHRFRIPSPS